MLTAAPALAQPGASTGTSEPVDSEALERPYAEDSDHPDTADPTPGTAAAKAAEDMTEPPKSIEPAEAEPAEPEPAAAAPAPAEPPPAEPPPADDSAPADPNQPFLPNAPDTFSGHLRLSVGIVGTLPFGNLESALSPETTQVGFHANFGNGFGIDTELSVGISRYVDVGAYGQYLWMGGNTIDYSDDSEDVKGSLVPRDATPVIFAVGGFVGYHLVQGTRFDPWISYGLGYRQTGGAFTPKFKGMDFIRLRVGGDWYASPALALGPFVGMDMGLFWEKETHGVIETIESKSLHFMAFFGFRALFDYPGR